MPQTVWFVGKHLASLTILGGVRDPSTGVVTYSGSSSLTNSADFIRVNASNVTEMIIPVNAGKTHNEPILVDSGCSVGEIKKKAGTILAGIAFGYTYARVIAVTMDGVTYQFDGVVGNMSDGVTATGKNTSELNLLQTSDGGLTRAVA